VNTKQLIDALAAVGFIPAGKLDSVFACAREFCNDRTLIGKPAEASAAAYFLSQSECSLDEGVVAHDFPFWNETDNVIAEFSRAVAVREVSFEQLHIEPCYEIHVRTTVAGKKARNDTLDIDGGRGLDAVVEHLNKTLEKTNLQRRVYALDTDELDWRVFVACEPEVAHVLSAAGQTRKLYL